MTRQEHLLTIAIEECNELAQRLSKILRFGMDEIQPGQSLTNVERARYEYSDLAAVLEMIAPPTPSGGQIHPPLGSAMDAKRAKVEQFLQYSAECGTLSGLLGDPEGPRRPPRHVNPGYVSDEGDETEDDFPAPASAPPDHQE